jgi:hypothetical protein
VSPKKKTMGQGKASLIGNLTASMRWLKNKTFFIPALASVLAVSVVGAVLAVQATNSPEVSLDESSSEAVDQPAIGFACVAGTVVCEEVKDILLETDYEEVLRTWTRSSLIDYFVGRHGRSLTFVTEVVDAVRFDWGDGSTYIGDFESDGPSASAGACVSGEPICDAARYVLVKSGQGKNFTRENFIEIWMSTYGATREKVEAIIQDIRFTDWASSASAKDSAGNPGSFTLDPCYSNPAEGKKLLSCAKNAAQTTVDFAFFSRRDVIEALVFQGYSNELATQAVDSLNVDWNLEAKQQAQDLVRQAGSSRLWLLGFLEDQMGFLASEAAEGVDSLNLDYLEQAVRATVGFLTRNPCDEQGVFSDNYVFDYLYEREGFDLYEADHGVNSQLVEGDDGWWWAMYPECVVPYDY